MADSTQTFSCTCCLCDPVKRLRDCCTGTDVDLFVCDSVTSNYMIIGNRCYRAMGTYSLEDAVLNGWQKVENFDLLEQLCFDDVNCYDYYSAWAPVCVGCGDRILLGPGTARDQLHLNEFITANGNAWIVRDGVHYYSDGIIAIKKCDHPVWPDGYSEGMVAGAWPLVLLPPDPNVSCNTWTDEFGQTQCYEVPTCLQVSGLTFSATDMCSGCTFSGPDYPDWDGRLTNVGGTYGVAPSYAVCGGNGSAILPGTDCNFYSVQVVWWDSTISKWVLDLSLGGYYWHGYGGSDPSDPTGSYTYTADHGGMPATPPCGGPTTLTVSKVTI